MIPLPTPIPTRFACVYLFVHRKTLLIYVGGTVNLKRRLSAYRADIRGGLCERPFEKALKNEGMDAFRLEILEEVIDLTRLIEREQHWLDTLQPFGEKGYNESRVANRTRWGRKYPLSPEERLKRGQLSRETALRTRDARVGPLEKPVYKIDTKTLEIVGRYPSAAEADRQHGFKPSTVNQVCGRDGERLTTHGFYWCYQDVYDRGEFKPRISARAPRAVRQLSLDGEEIRVWPSMIEAARAMGGRSCLLWQCCEGYCRTSKGFRWEYVSPKPLHVPKSGRQKRRHSDYTPSPFTCSVY